MRIPLLALIAAAAAVFYPAGAHAEDQTLVFRSGPITIAGNDDRTRRAKGGL